MWNEGVDYISGIGIGTNGAWRDIGMCFFSGTEQVHSHSHSGDALSVDACIVRLYAHRKSQGCHTGSHKGVTQEVILANVLGKHRTSWV